MGIQYAIHPARKEQSPIAVKSGGHSFEAFSSTDDSLGINLTPMKQMVWLDQDRVSIGAGCLLKEIQSALFPKQRLIPTGSCGTFGIAGLTPGGDYNFQ